jgi:hypothetical protein
MDQVIRAREIDVACLLFAFLLLPFISLTMLLFFSFASSGKKKKRCLDPPCPRQMTSSRIRLIGDGETSDTKVRGSNSEVCLSLPILLFSSTLKVKVVSTLTKTTSSRITLNIVGSPITSRTHSHPSHSQTSRLLTSSLSLGVPVPRGTKCMRDV